jgi:hypothetical protein
LRSLFAVVASATCLGCAPATDRTPLGKATVVRDGDGAWSIVVNETLLNEALARTTPLARPVATLRSPSGDPGFPGPIPLAFAANGRIVGRHANQVLIFESDGTLIRRVGRRGGGPGEFQMLNFAELTPGDSIIAFDRSPRRVTVFDERDAVVSVTPQTDLGITGNAYLVGRLGDGTWIGYVAYVFPPPHVQPGQMFRERHDVFRAWPAERRAAPLLTYYGAEQAVHAATGVMTDVKFARGTAIAVADSASFMLFDQTGTTLRIYDGDATVRGTIELSAPLPEVTRRERDSVRRAHPDLEPVISTHKTLVGTSPLRDGARWWFGIGDAPETILRWVGVGLDGSVVPGPRTGPEQYVYAVNDGLALIVTIDSDGFRRAGLHRWQ